MHNSLKGGLFLLLILPNMTSAELSPVRVNQFIDYMYNHHSFDIGELRTLFQQAKYSDKVLQAISKPAEKLAWHKYRSIFIRDARIEQGVRFWRKHQNALNKAEEIYGVPPQIITAIIGVETQYGQYTGKYQVIDSLATLAFHYGKREKFFRAELEQFLLLTREQNIDPLSLRGSYAGAMGIPQFISSSYRNYAVDFDQDGKKDLWHNPIDAIGSVANYFKQHHWLAEQPVAISIKVTDDKIDELTDNNLKPDIRFRDLKRYNIKSIHGIPKDALVKIMKFEQKDSYDYWLGMHNFYVITRYNHSQLYAMAVYQLSELIKAEYES